MDSETVAEDFINRTFCTNRVTGFTNILYAAPPLLNISCTVKDIGNIRVVRHRVMGLHERVNSPPFRKHTPVADDHGIILNPDLNRCAEHITVMGNGVENCFPYCVSGIWIELYTPVMAECDFCFQILEVYKVNNLVSSINQ